MEEIQAKPAAQDQANPDPVAHDLIERANAAAERMEKANERFSQLLAQQEKIQVEKILGGKTAAGSVEKTKEEMEIEEARAFLAGTGMEKYIV